MTNHPVRHRAAARVIVVDHDDHLLLLHGRDPADPSRTYWFTPGGGLKPGESARRGAARELFEETGLVVSPASLGAPVWRERVDIPFDGQVYRQSQVFFLLRVPRFEVVHVALDAVERRGVDGHRWWDVDQLRASGEAYYPGELADLLSAARG